MSETAASPPAPTLQPGPPTPAPARGSNGLATSGFVIALLGFLGSWIPVLNVVGIILGVLGAVLAAVGLARAAKVGTGKGLAITGLVLGALAVVIAIVINVAFANVVSDAIDETTDNTVVQPVDPDETDDDGPSDDGSNDAASNDNGASDEALGTTRANPAPIGSAITGSDWTVTINSVTTVGSDSLDQEPAEGSVLLLVNLTATYDGDDEQGASPWATVEYVTADGTTIGSLDGSSYFSPEDPFSLTTTVFNGASVTGDEILEVPADTWQDGVLAVTPDLFLDATFVAVT